MKPKTMFNPQSKVFKIISLIILVGVILIPRLAELDRYVTPDESLWLYRSGNFYYALGQREFEQTFQKSHPGVTLMWAGVLNYLIDYPEFRGQGQGYMVDEDYVAMEKFLKKQNRDPLDLLVGARIIMVVGNALALAAGFWLLEKLLGFWPAWGLTCMAALEPFFLGLTKLLSLDGLLASLMMVSSLAFIVYLFKGRGWRYLLISGFTAGLSWLTKTPGFFLFLFVGLLVLIEHFWKKSLDWGQIINNMVKPLVVWLGIATAAFVLLWPAIWVNPEMVYQEMIGETSGYFVSGHDSVMFFNDILDKGPGISKSFYPMSYIWTTTPATLLGLALVVLGIILRWEGLKDEKIRRLLLYLVLFAFFFVVAMNTGGKKANRYIIPIYPMLAMVGGMGWLAAGRQFKYKISAAPAIAILLAVAIQVSQNVMFHPYPTTYVNNMFGGPVRAQEIFTVGWGEGLDEAGRYLANKPNAEELTVLSWYEAGSFSYFFPGITLNLPVLSDWTDSSAKKLAQADYVVIYIHQWQRQIPQALLQVLFPLEPEYTVWINGLPYVQVYQVSEIPEEQLRMLTDGGK